MTTYATLAEVKAYLGITGTAQDPTLQIYLDAAESYINGYLDVDTLGVSDVTERVKVPRLNDEGYPFVFRKRPVTAIKTISGVTYTGVLGTDFVIENKRKVTLRYLNGYITNFNWDTISVVYTAGYSTIPAAIKLAEMMLVGAFNAGGGSNGSYSSYAIGDEKVVFKTQEELKQYTLLLKPYKLFV